MPKTHPNLTCGHCGGAVKSTAHKRARAAQDKPVFCSRSHAGAYNTAESLRGLPEPQCANPKCGGKLELTEYRRSRLRRGLKCFCGVPCHMEWQRTPEARGEVSRKNSKSSAEDWDGIFKRLADPFYYEGCKFQKQWQKQVGA